MRSTYLAYITVVTACVATASLPVQSEDSFPYTAAVVRSDATVRSGPGEEFYETDRLGAGEFVEVYRHDGNGWCAIRPPAESFSWVPAQYLELTENPSLGRIVSGAAKTRVGSLFSDIRDVEYISLREGEIVELLGSKQLEEASGKSPIRWFMIAPPAGEFRWIHVSTLSTRAVGDPQNPSEPIAPPANAAGEPIAVAIETYPISQDRSDDSDAKSVSEPRGGSLNVRPASFQTGRSSDAQFGAAEEAKASSKSEAGSTVLEEPGQPDAVTWRAVADPADPLVGPEPRSFHDKFAALNLMLSRAVLQDISAWELGPIQEQAIVLASSASAEEEATKVQSLLSKIEQFASLQRRSQKVQSMPAGTVSESTIADSIASDQPVTSAEPALLPEFDVDAAVAAESSGPEMPVIVGAHSQAPALGRSIVTRSNQTVDNSIFDGTGILTSVVSGRSGLPKLALTDGKGRILKFVTPPAGRDFHPFINKHVGVIGDASFVRSLNKPHIVARRIVALRQ